jgi:hypothetical protein
MTGKVFDEKIYGGKQIQAMSFELTIYGEI